MENLLPMTLREIVTRDLWSTAEGMHEGLPFMVRLREELRTRPNVSDSPRLVRIIWSYSTDASGMPSLDEALRMDELEDGLVDSLEPDLA
ncbi:MAG: DUF695 domain-containing protein, partial [Polyangiaceae bacterium]|nr:DUF695 domain-containing protein [Polyangiaceae bacterium]